VIYQAICPQQASAVDFRGAREQVLQLLHLVLQWCYSGATVVSQCLSSYLSVYPSNCLSVQVRRLDGVSDAPV
jgi:hypothetical protein